MIRTRRDLGRTAGAVFSWILGGEDEALFVRPYGLAWDGPDLLVTDPGAASVLRISAEGRIGRAEGGSLEEPIGVASCAAGIVVSDARTGRVELFRRDLRHDRSLLSDLVRPTGVSCEAGTTYVAETGLHRILVLDANGNRTFIGRRGSAPGEFNFPAAISLAAGKLLVGDVMNSRIQRFRVPGEELEASFGTLGDNPGEMPRVKGIARDVKGRLWVSDAYLNQVALYDENGAFLFGLGRDGSGPGEFSFPAGIAAHEDGRVAIVDSLNRRIQVFRLVIEASRK